MDDPFACAYAQLCREIRDRVTEAEFRKTRGEAVSEALSADSFSAARSETGAYRVGVDEERPDEETLERDVLSTWNDAELIWNERVDNRETYRKERWRIDVVREVGAWRVCGFSRRDSSIAR